MAHLRNLIYKNYILLKAARVETVLIPVICIFIALTATFSSYSLHTFNSRNEPTLNYKIKNNPPIGSASLYLLAAPNSSDVQLVLHDAAEVLNREGFQTTVVLFSDNEAWANALNSYYSQRSPNETYIGVQFDNLNGPQFHYSLLPNGNNIPDTSRVFCSSELATCSEPSEYFSSFTINVQYAINTALIWKSVANRTQAEMGALNFWSFAVPSSPALISSSIVISMVITLSMAFLPIVPYMTSKLVEEKECSMKQLLVVMGMNKRNFFLSWFAVFLPMLLFITCVMTIALSLSNMIKQSVGIYFLLTFSYSLCTIAMSFTLSTLLKKSRTAALVAALLIIAMNLLYLIQLARPYRFPFEYGVPVFLVALLMIFPPFTYAMALDLILNAEVFRGGLPDIFTFGDIPLIWSLLALWLAFLLFMGLAFVLEGLLSPEYGDKVSWLSSSRSPKNLESASEATVTYPKEDFEQPNSTWTPVIRIAGLWKAFSSGRQAVNAVRDVTLDFYDGQITCILGQNGAGKSTLIGMITHLLRPTAGHISYSTFGENKPRSIGLCLQTDSFYKKVTVTQILEIVARLKNVSQIDNAILGLMYEVGLEDCANRPCSKLSGGQKRRLNVAMALIGDPKVMFFDEPTSGVDPVSRRAIWQILLNRKARNCIILTTHYMDEADILADRKAIMSRGTLRCVGSSLFLKNRFGVGYHLNVELRDDLAEADLHNAKQNVLSLVQQHVPDAADREETQTSISITLPFKQVQAFSHLFNALDAPAGGVSEQTVGQSLGIRTYGIERTSLEEIFLKLAGEVSDEVVKPDAQENNYSSFQNDTFSGNLNPSEAQVTLEDQTDKLEELQQLLNDCEKPSVFWKLWVLIKLRCRMIRNAWIRTTFVVFFSPVLTFVMLAIAYATQASPIGGDNTKPLELDPLLYAAPSNGPSSLPPFIFDNQSDYDSEGLKFARTMSELSVKIMTVDNTTYDANVGLGKADQWNVWYSQVAAHGPPVALHTLSNYILRLHNSSYSIKTVNIPFGVSYQTQYNSTTAPQIVSPAIALPMMLVAIAMNIGWLSKNLQKDFACGAFNQVRCTGIGRITYWMAQQIVDSLLFDNSILFVALSLIFGSLIFTGKSIMSSVVVSILVSFIFAGVALNCLYIIALLLRKQSYQIFSIVTWLTFYAMPGMMFTIMLATGTSDGGSINVSPIFYFTLIFPNCLFFNAFYCILITPFNTPFSDYLGPPNPLFGVFLSGQIYMILLPMAVPILHGYLIEKNCRKSPQPQTTSDNKEDHTPQEIRMQDSDVLEEQQAVNSLLQLQAANSTGSTEMPPLVCHDLHLRYQDSRCSCSKDQTKTAVKKLTLSTAEGQIFGLLGPNGAGKTSVLKVIVGQEQAEKGDVFVDGESIKKLQTTKLFEKVSVCSQDNALWPSFTITDHLNFYASLRGYKDTTHIRLVQAIIDLLEIRAHAHKRADELSGGTQRKLSFAISMLKTRRVRLILCDEPTSGLDPQSKRLVWRMLTALVRSDPACACVFTSHSMEEVEAVCDRIGILINGEMHCFGSIQHCKDKFGGNFSIELKLRHPEGISELLPFLKQHFPHAQQAESLVEMIVRISLPRTDVTSIGLVFQILEQAKQMQSFEIEEYSFGQCSLEEVFLELVKKNSYPGSS